MLVFNVFHYNIFRNDTNRIHEKAWTPKVALIEFFLVFIYVGCSLNHSLAAAPLKLFTMLDGANFGGNESTKRTWSGMISTDSISEPFFFAKV